jgi:hypothetical protein
VKTVLHLAGSCGLALVLGACATANTPQQTLAYDRWARCAAPYASLQNVDLDGRITFLVSDSATGQEVFTCLAEAGRGGQALPAPRAVRPVGGP